MNKSDTQHLNFKIDFDKFSHDGTWYTIPDYAWAAFFITTFLVIYSIVVGVMISKLKEDEIPNRFLSFNITLVNLFNNFLRENVGIKWRHTAPSAYGLFFYILIANYIGLIGITMPSTFVAITIALSLFAVITIQYTAFRSVKFHQFEKLIEPSIIMLPMNAISEFSPIVSMAFRLFGNILSGTLILFMMYYVLEFTAGLFTPIMHVIFDMGFGVIQAYVFMLLTVVFSSMRVDGTDKYQNTDENFILEYRLFHEKQLIDKRVK